MFGTILNKFRIWNSKQLAMKIPYPSTEELHLLRYNGEKPIGTIVAFYTKNTFYEYEKNRLVKSTEALNLPIQTMGVDSTGSWVKNAGLKPKFLLQQRKEIRGPILYVDVDAVFHSNPWDYLLDITSDFAVYYQNDGRLVSATILINDTPNAIEIIEKWQAACESDPDKWDQVALEEILSSDYAKDKYTITSLPVSFCWIFDCVDHEKPNRIYIEQLQASREATKKTGLFKKIRRRLQRRRDRVLEIEKQLGIR